uniref:Uncharacterized protein n=1 Tax=Megaselia scalaris TaxID=36166 RepID=T1H5D3_MEGSC
MRTDDYAEDLTGIYSQKIIDKLGWEEPVLPSEMNLPLIPEQILSFLSKITPNYLPPLSPVLDI